MISVCHDYWSDHLPNKEEHLYVDYHSQIDDQRLAAGHKQRKLKNTNNLFFVW
ncbi:MAG: hypothetical protein Ta2E_11050 [Mycoplasmoidaceae bacterium]|nr:MAG: hypothetical protein Ta2E_11050 [Mycoplasmoidaceae bacterium]